MITNPECRAGGHAVTKQDGKFGGQGICEPCWQERFDQAMAAGDSDWFVANNLQDKLTEEQKNRLGL